MIIKGLKLTKLGLNKAVPWICKATKNKTAARKEGMKLLNALTDMFPYPAQQAQQKLLRLSLTKLSDLLEHVGQRHKQKTSYKKWKPFQGRFAPSTSGERFPKGSRCKKRAEQWESPMLNLDWRTERNEYPDRGMLNVTGWFPVSGEEPFKSRIVSAAQEKLSCAQPKVKQAHKQPRKQLKEKAKKYPETPTHIPMPPIARKYFENARRLRKEVLDSQVTRRCSTFTLSDMEALLPKRKRIPDPYWSNMRIPERMSKIKRTFEANRRT